MLNRPLPVFCFILTCVISSILTLPAEAADRPNILFITVDDMSCDSVGVFGCQLPGTTPHIDRLASESLRFAHAHVQVGNCVPSRNVMQTGRYPHNSRVEGFYQVKPDYDILPDVLKHNGYFTAIKGKVSHSTPFHPYDWDLVLTPSNGARGDRNATQFYELTRRGIQAGRDVEKPFYLVININDPHKPFYGLANNGTETNDPNKPTRIFKSEEVPVPGFLPDEPIVRKELSHYYSSVRRADDCVGEVLRALDESGERDRTVVMFLSDHGMPFPFAKTSLYHYSTHTPWMVRWPGVTQADSVDSQHMISAVDFMPTILEIADIAEPQNLDGRSFAPLLRGESQTDRDLVFKVYNENSGAGRHPMRSVCSRRFGYIFNPWSNGERAFKTATMGTLTFRRMKQIAQQDEAMANRVKFFEYNVREEFYDYENDPDALNNLIDRPEYQAEINRLRQELENWMVETGDHALKAFQNRNDDAVVEAYMARLEQESAARKQDRTLSRNYKPNANQATKSIKRRDDLFDWTLPTTATLSESVTVTIRHTLPPELGDQLVHVTLKRGGKQKRRIERKVVTVNGTGEIQVTFDVPKTLKSKNVSFAAFVGADFQHNLQYLVSKSVPLNPPKQ